jgi:ATPase subunit of ABC transporter with duplicated ATPase domains
MFELSLNGVKKYMDATLVLKSISFQVYAGEKVGIVGVNGSGKSTILKLIAGILPMNYYPGYPQTSSLGYDEGFINLPREASCAYLEQIPEYEESLKVIDVLNLAFKEVLIIENQMRESEEEMKLLEGIELDRALRKYSDLLQKYEVMGGYNIDEKLNKICKGLKFEDSFLNKPFNLLSGGEKTSVLLGKLLIHNPDILLLDEPTNHLDMDSIEWLEDYLKNYKGIVIIVSHDRYFLDNVVTKIVEIEDRESLTYKGNYSSYVEQKEENLRIQFEHFKEQQKKINAMEKTVKDLRDWAMRADNNKFFRRAASLQIKLDKLNRIEKPEFDKKNMNLNIKTAERSGNDTVKAIGLYKSFEDKIIFKDANMLIRYGERTALIGPNGCGKTTFLRILLGEEIPDAGVVALGSNVMTAYLPQKVSFKDEELTVLDCFREDLFILEGKAREYLSKFMFYGSNVFKKVRHLSGGEKIRLKLAKLLYQDVNLLILDEPTNHLDIDSIETFEVALENFKGTIFFISHDRYFINKMGDRVIAIEGNAFKSYDGNYDYYKNIKDKQRLQDTVEVNEKNEKIKATKNIIDAKKTNKTRNVDEGKIKEQEKAKIEIKVEKLEREIREIDLAMTDSKLDHEEVNKLYCRKAELDKELEEVMEIWLSVN